MHYGTTTKTKSLLATSDLTLAAQIKTGLSAAVDVRSYESRLRILLATLSAARVSSKEAYLTPLIDDAVDGIHALHSFRLAIVGDRPKQLVLAVTFDGGWEPYMRRIWRDLGPLLDVIFCHCEGYLASCDHTFAEYTAWVRGAQVGTEFFYNASALTVSDLHYLRKQERDRLRKALPPQMDFPPKPADVFHQALPALTALYRLTDMFLVDPLGPRRGDDAQILLRAADHLLGRARDVLHKADPDAPALTPAESAALKWFRNVILNQPRTPPTDGLVPDKIQGGIVESYPDMTHGCMLLVELKNAAAAEALLQYLRPDVTTARQQVDQKLPPCCINIAFTLQGLSVAGVPHASLEQMPFEFREGMSARASLLGDYDYNHPTRWPLPERNWPPKASPTRVELSSVHVIVQFMASDLSVSQKKPTWQGDITDPAHPLCKPVRAFEQALNTQGVHILSVQLTQRYIKARGEQAMGHFVFADGLSQPVVGGQAPPAAPYANHVPLGDLLLGYENSRHDPPCKGRLWDDSTFVVIRKLQQDVDAFDALLDQTPSLLKKDDVKAQLMGRYPDGRNLIDNTLGNNFTYERDLLGAKCPMQSHVRRANPRGSADGKEAGHKVPRIIRRGMAYGPDRVEIPRADRGLLFTAYNASIAEQFEVIQAWLSGGNSSSQDSYSGLRDPFVGVHGNEDPQCFVFGQGKHALALDPKRPLVKLLWGLYAFVPSIQALAEIEERAREAARSGSEKACPYHKQAAKHERARERSTLSFKGAQIIKLLEMTERQFGVDAAKTQWKIALEDFTARMSGNSRAIWAAVRELHGGVLRTPYGVLVCKQEWVNQVYANANGAYTVTGYAERLKQSIGDIYLGMDDSPTYRNQANPVNAAIFKIKEDEAFDEALKSMHGVLSRFVPASPGEEATVEVKDLVDAALADLCVKWFGIPDGKYVVAGTWSWDSKTPTCPGHFQSPSRYTFQPNPGPEAMSIGRNHGQALQKELGDLLKNDPVRRNAICATPIGGPIAVAAGKDDSLFARNLIGAMMGMLPTVDGNLRGALYEWVKDGSLWDHQLSYLGATGTEYERALETLLPPLRRAMRLRPVPELVWRIAQTSHPLGTVDVKPGDTVVVSIVSAGQENLLKDDADEADLSAIFGGHRKAVPAPTGEPLHACPGYKMAMGTLLGMLAGLVEGATLRPTFSPTTVTLSRP